MVFMESSALLNVTTVLEAAMLFLAVLVNHSPQLSHPLDKASPHVCPFLPKQTGKICEPLQKTKSLLHTGSSPHLAALSTGVRLHTDSRNKA